MPIPECTTDNNVARAGVFALRVADPEGLFDTQTFSAYLGNVNAAPEIETAALLPATVNRQYRFALQANDPDRGDALNYEVVAGPDRLDIESVSGVVFWSPGVEQVGLHNVEIAVTDLDGLRGQRSYTLEVLDAEPPVFVSEPVTSAFVGALYRYDARAVAPNGEPVEYQLALSPEGMQIDRSTGTIVWIPEASQAGSAIVSVRAVDSSGVFALQDFTVAVTGNNAAPVITSQPETRAYSPTALRTVGMSASVRPGHWSRS